MYFKCFTDVSPGEFLIIRFSTFWTLEPIKSPSNAVKSELSEKRKVLAEAVPKLFDGMRVKLVADTSMKSYRPLAS